MNSASRWFIKVGMLYLVTGVFLLLMESVPGLSVRIPLLPVYWHMIAIGWITQVIIGVSIWMFPRAGSRTREKRDRKARNKHAGKAGGSRDGRTRNRKDERIAWTIFILLNTGLLLRLIAEAILSLDPGNPHQQWCIVVSIGLQTAGIGFYILEIWPRVRPKRKRKVKGGGS